MPEIHVVPGVRERFSIVSNAFAQNPDLTPRAARVYLYLRACPPRWRMSVRRLAGEIKMSTGTVNGALRDLEELGYLVREETKDDQGRFSEVVYHIYEESIHEDDRVSENDTRDDDRVSKNRVPKNRVPKIDTHNKNNKNKNEPNKTPTDLTVGVPPTGDLVPVQAEIVPAEPPKPDKQRGHRLPEGWEPPAEVIHRMRGECPGVDLWQEHLIFSDYWRAQPGAKGRKVDWVATWRNWMRRAQKDAAGSSYRPSPPPATSPKADGYRDAAERLKARMEAEGWEL